jgi:hypothetical protein
MGANIDDPADLKSVFESLRLHFGELAELPDYEDLAKTMIRLDVRAEERNKILDDPFMVERLRDLNDTMSRLSPAERETIRQFVIHRELSTAGVKMKVKNSGIDMARWSVPDHLVQITGWISPKSGNKPYDDMQLNVYSINPEMLPLLTTYFLAKD